MAREQKLDQPSQHQSSREPSPGTHRKRQQREITQAFYLLQTWLLCSLKVSCFPRAPEGHLTRGCWMSV